MRKIILFLLFLLCTVPAYAQSPEILSFSIEAVYINRSDLLAGTARVPVRWEVINRSEMMNLAFEQILPDGSTVNVELPRSNPWVNSVDRGIVALLDPGATATEIQVQVRLYSTSSGETLDSWVHTLAISESPSNPAVSVNSFTVSTDSATEGDIVTVRWDVSGVDSVHIGMTYTGLRLYSVNELDSYPNVGTAEFTVPEGVRTARLLLFANESLEQSLTIEVNCRVDWLMPVYEDACPEAEAQTIPVVYQAFEGGYTISGANPSAYIWIYVEESNSFLVRPAGSLGEFSEALASASAPEIGYEMRYQQSPWSIGTRGNRYYVFSLPDGSFISASIPAF